MLKRYLILFFLLIAVGFSSIAQNTSHEPGIYKFIPNGGQWPQGVNYMAKADAGIIWLEEQGILYEFQDFSNLDKIHHHQDKSVPAELQVDLIYMHFVGSNVDAKTEANHPSSEYYSFFKGNDESKWAKGLYGYSHITYENLYDGADLLMLEKDGELKYEFHLKPGADPTNIKIEYKGQKKLQLKKDGSLSLQTELGELREQKPFAYQVKNGRVIEISCEFVLIGNQVTYELGDYDASLKLVIDPVLIFATYAGSPTDNFGMTATYAYDGKAYSGGITFGSSYPTPGPAWNITSTIPELNAQANQAVQYGVTDVFISKYSADGTQMLWTCILGGGSNLDGTETVHSLICDTSNNVYLYGATSSQDFPLVNEYQSTHGGGISGANFTGNGTYFLNNGTDIWVSKLSSDGMNLIGSTYVGGDGNDGLNNNFLQNNDSLTFNYGDQFRGEIMLDSLNNVIIASSTNSTNFPTINSFQSGPLGLQDGVVFKLSADFSTMIWSTYYGGTDNDACYSVKIDSSYNIIIAGGTSSPDLPGTAGAYTNVYQGGKTDGYVAKISPDGSSLIRTSYLGTNDYDQVFFIEIDRWDNVYLLGQSAGSMPVINAPYSNANSGQFITKLNPNLSAVEYSTIFGSGNGAIDISPAAFLVDVCGNVYCTGWAGIAPLPGMAGMPITLDAFQSTPPNGNDFYLFVLERDAQSMLYGSYIGGNAAGEHVDGGTSRFDKFGIVYQSVCGGCGGNSDFPTTSGAWSSTNDANNCNNLVFKFDFEIVPEADFTISDVEGCAPFTFILDNESNDTINSVWTFPPEAQIIQGGINPEILFTDPGQYEIFLSITDTICNLQDTAVKVINVYDALLLDVMNDTAVCDENPITIWANSFGTGTSFIWYDDPAMTNQINAGGLDSTVTVNPTTTTTYYVHASNGWPLCDIIDSVTIVLADGAIGLDDDLSMCLGDTLFFTAHNLLPSETMSYSWSPSTGVLASNDSTLMVSPSSSIWYYLTATTGSGCVFFDSIYIDVNWIDPNTVYATATPDSIPSGATSVLEAFPNVPGYTYEWWPTGSLDTAWGQSVIASPTEDQEYLVYIEGDECEVATKVKVTIIEFICGDIYIFIPSAFSPNGDNENDVLYIRGAFLESVDLKIFNRWGEMVFQTQDQSVGWDGTYKGELVDPDVYVYHFTAVCYDGQEKLFKGNVTVLR